MAINIQRVLAWECPNKPSAVAHIRTLGNQQAGRCVPFWLIYLITVSAPQKSIKNEKKLS